MNHKWNVTHLYIVNAVCYELRPFCCQIAHFIISESKGLLEEPQAIVYSNSAGERENTLYYHSVDNETT